MNNKKIWLTLAGIFLISGFISLYASGFPDGLEYVAEQLGFIDTAQDPRLSIIPDYVVPGIANGSLAASLAGIIGSLGVFAALYLLAKKLYRPSLD